MALAFDSGIASNQNDLLDKIIAFCVSNGWTTNRTYASTENRVPALVSNVGEPDGVVYNIQKVDSYGETCYFNFYACYKCIPNDSYVYSSGAFIDFQGKSAIYSELNGICMYGSTGYTASPTAWDKQPGFPHHSNDANSSGDGATINFIRGQNVNYWFYSQGDSIHVIVELWAGLYGHMSFGTIVKQGATANPYVGGQYCNGMQGGYHRSKYEDPFTAFNWHPYGTRNDSCVGQVRVTYATDGITNWRPIGSTYTGDAIWSVGVIGTGLPGAGFPKLGSRHINGIGLTRYVYTCTPSQLSLLNAMSPIYFTMLNANTLWMNVGYPEGVRCLNTKYLTNESIEILGSDNWQIFPSSRNNPVDPPYEIFVPGFAYLKE